MAASLPPCLNTRPSSFNKLVTPSPPRLSEPSSSSSRPGAASPASPSAVLATTAAPLRPTVELMSMSSEVLLAMMEMLMLFCLFGCLGLTMNLLRKYSLGGRGCIDMIMQFLGCISLTISLLDTGSPSACEAAAGLLRTITSVSVYRDAVADRCTTEEVKEQSLCTLWNLSVDKKYALKIANSDLLVIIVKLLNDEEVKIKEAVGGVLANIVLIPQTQSIMVEAGVIQKLAALLRIYDDVSKVLPTEAKSVLLELAADEYFKILIIEEGLVLVPLVGAAAYKSFRPVSNVWPSLPDGTELKRQSQTQSRYGTSELLVGVNMEDESTDLDEAKMNAIVGRTHQQFLARIGAIEKEDEKPTDHSPTNQLCTL